MLTFNPANPFPLLESHAYTESEAQDHGEKADQWLGLQTAKIEAQLLNQGCRMRAGASSKQEQQLWIGLAPPRLQTPYVEIRRLLHLLDPQPGETVVDLGAAYGRMGFVIAQHYPKVSFVGYEYVGERVQEARRVMKPLRQVRMEHVDLNLPSFVPEPAKYYFLYDFGSPKTIEKVLHNLRRIAQTQQVVIIGRGKYMRETLIRRHSWLQPTLEMDATFTVCCSLHPDSRPEIRTPSPFDESNS